MGKGSRRSALRAQAANRLRSGDDSGGERTPPSPTGERVEDGFVVRRVAGGDRTYRCPGCDHEMAPGQPHVVAWPDGRADDRRHWHTACWQARGQRGVKVHRSKNAPRYG